MGLKSVYNHIDKILSSLVIIISVIALYGWIIDDLSFARILPLYIPIAPSTAFSFLFLAVIALFLITKRIRLHTTVSYIGLYIVIMFSLVILLNSIFNLDWNIETIFIRTPGNFRNVRIGRMSPLTAFLFVIESITFLLMYSYTRKGISKVIWILIIVSLFISTVLLIGYLYNGPILYESSIIPVALLTAICFWLLSIVQLHIVIHKIAPQSYFHKSSISFKLTKTFFPIFFLVIIMDGFLDKVVFISQNHAIEIAINMLIVIPIVGFIIAIISRNIGKSIERAEQAREIGFN